jgi:hypothetical protein
MLAPTEMRIIGELMALARAGKIEPTPRKEEPMADAQKRDR